MEFHGLKSKFLGRDVRVVGKEEVICTKSTTQLDTQEFASYVDQIVAWAGSELSVNIPGPGE